MHFYWKSDTNDTSTTAKRPSPSAGRPAKQERVFCTIDRGKGDVPSAIPNPASPALPVEGISLCVFTS